MTYKFEGINDMEKHTLENWGKVPKGYTPEKELAINKKYIRKRKKEIRRDKNTMVIIKEIIGAGFLLISFLVLYIIGALLF